MRRTSGAVLAVLWCALAAQKSMAGLAPELLWLCHVTSALLALGLLADLTLLVAVGFVCQLGLAAPAYVLHLASGGETSAVSFLLHVLAPVAGWLALRGKPIPAAAPWCAGALYLLLLVLCNLATPASLNVNLAFRPWTPVDWAGVWPMRAVNLALVLAQVHGVRLLWNRPGRAPS